MISDSWNWASSLNANISSRLQEFSWHRVELGKNEKIYGESNESPSQQWYELKDDGSRRAINIAQDSRLSNVQEVLGTLLSRGHRVKLMAHRVGRRAVFHTQLKDSACIHKLYRRAPAVKQRWSIVQEHNNHDYSSPQVLSWCPDSRHLKIQFCQGENFHDLCMEGKANTAHSERLLGLMRWLQSIKAPDDLDEYGKQNEIKLLQERFKISKRLLLKATPGSEELVARVCTALNESSSTPLVLTHRDLYDKQILFHGEHTTLLDLDLLARAPAALDCGNLISHLRLRALQEAALPWQEIVHSITEPLLMEGIQNLPEWTASTLCRLSLIYAQRNRAQGLLESLISSANDALLNKGEWEGLLQ